MREVLKKVYYCDFCKKKGLRKHAIKVHEEHCTKNINRKCRICDLIGESVNLGELIAKYSELKVPVKSNGSIFPNEVHIKGEDILNDCNGCPACTLSVIRLCDFTFPYIVDFNYEEEMNKFWAEYNSDKERYY